MKSSRGDFDRTTGRGDQATAIGGQDDVGREHVEEALQIAEPDGGKEPIEGHLLLGRADRHTRVPGRHVIAGPVGDLADGCGRLAHRLGDLLVGRIEHFAQHETRRARPDRASRAR